MEGVPTILIVDKHPIFRYSLGDWLRVSLRPCLVQEVENGEDALAFAKEALPDIVVTDLKLPDISGLDVTRKIMELDSNIAVVVISLHQGKAYRDAALQAGAVEFVNKFDLSLQLVPTLKRLLASETRQKTQKVVRSG